MFSWKMQIMKSKFSKSRFLNNKLVVRSFWTLLLLAVWEAVALSGAFSPVIFPSLETVAIELLASVINGEIINDTFFSLVLIMKGLIIGIAAAALLSSLSIASKAFGGFVDTLTAFAHPLPGIAILPLVIIWFGIGTESIIFIIVHSVMWPLVLNLLAGFKSIPAVYKEVGQNFGLNSYLMIKDVLFPASMPYLLAGLRIGWARSWRALISAEMIFGAAGGKGGLGWFIFKQRVFMDTAGIFAGLVVIIIIGIVVEDVVFGKIEKMTVKKWGMMS